MYKHKSRLILGERKVLLFFTASSVIYFTVIFLSFRYIRNFFPVPQVSDSKIVGYAHFTGYPFYFDLVLVFSIVLFPLVFFYCYREKMKNEKNK